MNRAMELRANSYRVTLLARPVTRKYLGNGSWHRPVAIPKKNHAAVPRFSAAPTIAEPWLGQMPEESPF